MKRDGRTKTIEYVWWSQVPELGFINLVAKQLEFVSFLVRLASLQFSTKRYALHRSLPEAQLKK